MTRLTRTSAVAAAFALASSLTLVPAVPVQAQGLFGLLFNSPERERQARLRAKLASGGVRVSSPKYKTYEPDRMKTVSLAKLAEPPAPPQAEKPADGDSSAPDTTGSTSTASDATSPTSEAAAETAPPTPFELARDQLADMKVRTLDEVGKALIAYYSQNPRFIWIADSEPNTRADLALAAFDRAQSFGLEPDDYRVSVTESGEEARERAAMAFEMNMSAKALTYVLDATRGRIDPNRISGYHDLPRAEVDLVAALEELSQSADAGAWLEARNPDSEHFRALKAELAALRNADDGDRITINLDKLLRPGQSDPELANVIAAIRKRASDELKAKHADTLTSYLDGPDYTPPLVALVKDFQRERHLHPDGVIGPATISRMTSLSNDDKIEKVKLAMERSRWLPHELGDRHVFINEPAYTATYMQKGQEPFAMRAVVGTKSNQTSFFYDEIETVEYNPYWGVPHSIIVNEYLPKLSSDPGYFDRIGYEVSTVNGRQVSSADVDWYAVAAKQSSINVRQRPGSGNALGAVKIMFPNKHSIYMHDTPQKHLFARDTRAYSHGCVRLENPRGMAAAVLGKSKNYVDGRIAQGKNATEDVPVKIPVYVSYFTAWPTQDGTVKYYVDVYDRDMYLKRAIDATRAVRQSS